MDKKYELIEGDTIKVEDGCYTLYRIRALRNFGWVKKGDLGGYIEKEENLSHEGYCWVSGNAKVYGDAKISDNAKVFNNAEVCGSTYIFDNAKVCDRAKVDVIGMIYGDACIYENAYIHGFVRIFGDVIICSNAEISGECEISNHAIFKKNADIKNNNDYLVIDNIGSRNDTITFYKGNDGKIYVTTGCYTSTIKEFKNKVKEIHSDNEFGQEYELAIKMARNYFKIERKDKDNG